MVIELAPSPQTQTVNGTATHLFPDVCEAVVFCPGCKTLETLWFNNGSLMPTRKFNQQGEQVFHGLRHTRTLPLVSNLLSAGTS
jgi:hypothetical protein